MKGKEVDIHISLITIPAGLSADHIKAAMEKQWKSLEEAAHRSLLRLLGRPHFAVLEGEVRALPVGGVPALTSRPSTASSTQVYPRSQTRGSASSSSAGTSGPSSTRGHDRARRQVERARRQVHPPNLYSCVFTFRGAAQHRLSAPQRAPGRGKRERRCHCTAITIMPTPCRHLHP